MKKSKNIHLNKKPGNFCPQGIAFPQSHKAITGKCNKISDLAQLTPPENKINDPAMYAVSALTSHLGKILKGIKGYVNKKLKPKNIKNTTKINKPLAIFFQIY